MASVFTKILRGEIHGEILYQDDLCAAIRDIQPQAPVHVLIFPKKEIRSVAQASAGDQEILGRLLLVAAQVARDLGISERGYRLVVNTGSDGGQTVSHLHVHLLAGRAMGLPLA